MTALDENNGATENIKAARSVSSLIKAWEARAQIESKDALRIRRARREQVDSETMIQGLTPAQITLLAQKVYDLMRDEMRIEAERHGRMDLR